MGEIATAFVRIRPNMAGFRSETQSGVRGAFSGVGKIVAGAIGAIGVGEIVKSGVEAAASLQKQLEAIRFEFGRASEGLIRFADTTGIALGDSNRSTDEASARFGRLFLNLGIGKKKAAEMTLGFERLALSVNAIRGGGASGADTLLRQIVLAAAGNTRGLKQMGVVVDSTSEKIAAFKLGLISSMSQALTPAVKTQAIYAIAMAHMGEISTLANKHLGDLANVQARLSAEFVLAKERLGNALLPFMARFVGFLADKLPGAMDVLFGVLRDMKTEFVTAFDVVKPVFEPIVRVVRSVVDAFKGGGGIGGALSRLRADFSKLSPAAKIAVVALGGIAAAFAAIVITSFPITSIIVLGAALAEAYRRSAAFRAGVAQLGAFFRGTIVPAFHAAAAAVNQFFHSAPVTSILHEALRKLISAAKDLWVTFKVVFHAVAQVVRVAVGIILAIWHHFGGTIVASIKANLTIVAAVFHGAMEVIRGIIDVFAGIFTLNWRKLWKGLKEIMGGFLHAAVTALRAWGGVVKQFFVDLWHTIEKVVLQGIEKVVHLLAKIPTELHTPFGSIGFKNPFDGWDDKLKNTIANIGKTGKHAVKTAASVQKGVKHGLQKTGNDPGTKSVAKQTGKKIGDAIGQGTAQGVSAAAPAIQKTLSDTMQRAVAAANKKIQDSVRGAKNNLDKIGQDLAKTISDIQAKLGGAAGALAGSPQGKAFQKLKQLIESGAPAFEIQRARASLSSQLENVGQTTGTGSVIGTQLANLTAEFNKGQIGYKQFQKRLHEILSKDGFTLAQALKAAGPALADQLKAEIRAMAQQAKAIAAVPARFRNIGGAGGGSDIKIVRPLEVIKAEGLRLRVVTQKAQAQAKAAVAKQQALQRSFNQVQIAGVSATRHGTRATQTVRDAVHASTSAAGRHAARAVREGIHAAKQRATGLAEAKKHTSLLRKIAGEHAAGKRLRQVVRAHQATTAAVQAHHRTARERPRASRKAQIDSLMQQLLKASLANNPAKVASLTARLHRLAPKATAPRRPATRPIRPVPQRVTVNPIVKPIIRPILRPRITVHTATGKERVTVRVVNRGPGNEHLFGLFQASVNRLLLPLNALRLDGLRVQQAITSERHEVVRAITNLQARMVAQDRALLAAELRLVHPINGLRSDQARIAANAAAQRERLIRSSERGNVLLRKLDRKHHGPQPGHGKTPYGAGSHHARQHAMTGGR